MLTIPELFLRLGLSKYAGVVYEALEGQKPLLATDIVRVSSLHRPAAYKGIHELTDSGLLIKTMHGKRVKYVAAPRSHAYELFQNESAALPDVQAAAALSVASVPSVTHLTGPDGIRAVFDDMLATLRRGETFYRYTSERDLDEVNSYLSSSYRKIRDQKRLERLVISNPESGKRKRSRLERFVKFLGTDAEQFDQNAIQLVYGDKIALIDLNTKQSLIIENATLASFQRTIFKALYKRL